MPAAASLPPDENFDAVEVPRFPENWAAAAVGQTDGWRTIVEPASTSAPNAAFTEDPVDITDASLTSPPIAIEHDGVLTFMHKLGLEAGYDGAVLELAIGDGPFRDIIEAGGEFVQGGYTGTIPSDFGNPLAGRDAWEGSSGEEYLTVIVRLPSSINRRTVHFRWRVGTDHGDSGAGYWIDNVHVDVSGSVTDRIFSDCFEDACH